MAWSPHKKGKLISRVRGWLSQKHDDEPLSALRLVHIDSSSGIENRVVGRWNPPYPDADLVCAQVVSVVEDDADVWGGTQRYALIAHFGQGGATTESASISQHGAATDEDKDLNAGPSERANSAGLIAQHMRFTEGAIKILAKATENVIEKLAEENNSLRERAASDDARRIKSFEMQEALLSKISERRIQEEDAALERGIKKELVGYGKVLVPIIGNHLAGDKIFPEVKTPEQMAMGAFFDELTTEQWQAMLAPLPGPQQMFLNHLLAMHLEAKEKAAGQYKGDRPLEMTNGAGNGRSS